MGDLIRKQFYITRNQDMLLKSKAKQLGVTEAEIVREALNHQISKVEFPKEPLTAWQEEAAYIEKLMNNKQETSLARSWKRNDLYDR